MTTSSCIRAALLLTMPMLLSGCMITGYSYMSATHDVYRDDKVKSVERAVETPDGKLVVVLDGKMACASKPGPFTITIPLVGPDAIPKNDDVGVVLRSAIVEGRHLPEGREGDLLPISVVWPVILPAADENSFDANMRNKFPGLEGSERTLYVTWNKHDQNAQLFYVVPNVVPRQKFYRIMSKNDEHPPNYPWILRLPLTVPADVATFPLQLFVWALNPDR